MIEYFVLTDSRWRTVHGVQLRKGLNITSEKCSFFTRSQFLERLPFFTKAERLVWKITLPEGAKVDSSSDGECFLIDHFFLENCYKLDLYFLLAEFSHAEIDSWLECDGNDVTDLLKTLGVNVGCYVDREVIVDAIETFSASLLFCRKICRALSHAAYTDCLDERIVHVTDLASANFLNRLHDARERAMKK